MYYEFKRFQRGRRDSNTPEPFSGWVNTWDGRIREASRALHSLVGEPVETLIEWANRNNIEWHVWQVKP